LAVKTVARIAAVIAAGTGVYFLLPYLASAILTLALIGSALRSTTKPPARHPDPAPLGSSPRQLWTIEGNFSAPAIDGNGTIYVTDHHALVAVNSDGTERWRYTLKGEQDPRLTAPVLVPGRRVVTGARGRMLAINADGTLAWTFKSGDDFDPLSRPALSADGRLYTLGTLKAITYGLTPDGKPIWTFDGGYYTNPLQVDPAGRVYLTIGGKLFVRDADGERLWTYGEPTAYGRNVPIAFDGDGTTYIAGKKLAAVGADGAVRWESVLATDALGCVATGAIIRNDVIYFGCDDRVLAYGRDGSKRWEVKTETTVTGTAIAEDGTVYVVAANLYALNLNGTVRWQFTPERPYSTRPSTGPDGTIYVASPHQVHAVRPDGKLLWQTTAGREESSSQSGPQLRWLDGALLFSAGHQTAYQIDSARLVADKAAWQ
jgi:hypothetical protein